MKQVMFWKILIITIFVGSRFEKNGTWQGSPQSLQMLEHKLFQQKIIDGEIDLSVKKRPLFEEFCAVLCENYGGWRWSILSRFWRILSVLVFGMSVCMSMSIWNGFGISWVMELEWINETKWSTVRFCHQNVDFSKFWKLISKIMFSNPKP